MRSAFSLSAAVFPVALLSTILCAQEPSGPVNLAVVATASASYISGDTSLTALNDGFVPRSSRDRRRGSFGNWNRTGTQWVEYNWSQPVSTKKMEVYWWDDRQGVHLPKACRLKYWDGGQFVEVSNPSGLGVAGDQFNATTFDEVTTAKLRLEMDSDGEFSTGVLEWRVLDSGKSPEFPPRVHAGVDRDVMLDGKTYLSGTVAFLKPNAGTKVTWSKESGPGKVTVANARTNVTTATFSEPGDYVLKLTAGHRADGGSAGRPGDHCGPGKDEGDDGGLDSQNPRGAGTRWLFANGLHTGRPQPLAVALESGATRQSRRLCGRLFHRVGDQSLY